MILSYGDWVQYKRRLAAEGKVQPTKSSPEQNDNRVASNARPTPRQTSENANREMNGSQYDDSDNDFDFFFLIQKRAESVKAAVRMKILPGLYTKESLMIIRTMGQCYVPWAFWEDYFAQKMPKSRERKKNGAAGNNTTMDWDKLYKSWVWSIMQTKSKMPWASLKWKQDLKSLNVYGLWMQWSKKIHLWACKSSCRKETEIGWNKKTVFLPLHVQKRRWRRARHSS